MAFISDQFGITADFIEEHVTSALPDCRWDSLSATHEGVKAVALDFGHTITRFPKRDEFLANLRTEATVCARLDIRALRIPKPSIAEGPYPFSWHAKILGGHLTRAVYKSVTDAEKVFMIDRLARFFAEMQAVPVKDAKAWGAPDLWLIKPADALAQNAHLIADPLLRRHFDGVLGAYAEIDQRAADPVFGHFDAHGENMAFDSGARELVGIYDFEECAVGDIHREFISPAQISLDLWERLIDGYEASTGRLLDRERIKTLTLINAYDVLLEVAAGSDIYPANDRCRRFIEHLVDQGW